jgi:hypothetical protein
MTPNLNEEERNIYDLIVNSGSRITQLQLARKVFVGCHERFEGYDTPKQSTLRKVRYLVRELIMKHGLFIGADNDGYYIIKTDAEKKEYMDRFERQARASAKSYMQRYQVMSRNLNIKSNFFEQQGKLFG